MNDVDPHRTLSADSHAAKRRNSGRSRSETGRNTLRGVGAGGSSKSPRSIGSMRWGRQLARHGYGLIKGETIHECVLALGVRSRGPEA